MDIRQYRGYAFPDHLIETVEPSVYFRWLFAKAASMVRRDKKRGNTVATPVTYRDAIHQAVVASGGCDHYTGEQLDWSLIGKYDNEESQARGRAYKKELAALPTLDHVDEGRGAPNFVICSWRTNDGKHDLDHGEFLALCQKVLEHQGYEVRIPNKALTG